MPRLACPEEPRVTLHVVQAACARSPCFSCAGDRAAILRELPEGSWPEQCAGGPTRRWDRLLVLDETVLDQTQVLVPDEPDFRCEIFVLVFKNVHGGAFLYFHAF